MTTEPTGGPDWGVFLQWGGATGAFVVGLFIALFRRGKTEEVGGPAPTIVDSKVVTADSSAMAVLAGSVEANTAVMTENNHLQKEILENLSAIRKDVADYLSVTREERKEDRLVKRLKDELREDRDDDRG